MTKKEIMCAFGTDIDSVAGGIGSYGGGDSSSDIQRGIFASEVGVPRLLRLFKKYGLRTSFFIPGHSIETFPRQMEEIVKEGHVSLSSPDLSAPARPPGCATSCIAVI
jgi:hypothetical protein